MAGLFKNWLNFLHELAGKLGQDLVKLRKAESLANFRNFLQINVKPKC